MLNQVLCGCTETCWYSKAASSIFRWQIQKTRAAQADKLLQILVFESVLLCFQAERKITDAALMPELALWSQIMRRGAPPEDFAREPTSGFICEVR
jgi:hypothetical protein